MARIGRVDELLADWGDDGPMSGDMIDEVAARAALEAKLAELDEQMADMTKPPTEQANISFGKRVGDGTQMAIDRLSQVEVHDTLRHTRAEVERALVKLDEGTYGRCDVCGDPIPQGRLEVRPWAVLCVKDSARA